MDNMEFNKIFAAILVAGIVAYLGGFISHKLVHPHSLEKDAVAIEGIAGSAAGGPTKPTGPEPILAMIADADIAQGEKLSRACAACHSFDNGGPNGTGPNLWNKINASVASKPGFDYSDAMKAHGGTWTYAEMNHFLWKPKAYIEGTKMNYLGLKKPEDRAALIAWLRTLSSSPAALPSQAEIDAEMAELAPEMADADGTAEEAVEEAAETVAEPANH
ncbi:MAG TPA: cytochrome c family protein [Micavibrio sp.]|nr:cytochrome c family protein [Micavibrio sp.]HIL28592.1 cytochrome c family protein [Micavibrio sp.]